MTAIMVFFEREEPGVELVGLSLVMNHRNSSVDDNNERNSHNDGRLGNKNDQENVSYDPDAWRFSTPSAGSLGLVCQNEIGNDDFFCYAVSEPSQLSGDISGNLSPKKSNAAPKVLGTEELQIARRGAFHDDVRGVPPAGSLGGGSYKGQDDGSSTHDYQTSLLVKRSIRNMKRRGILIGLRTSDVVEGQQGIDSPCDGDSSDNSCDFDGEESSYNLEVHKN